MKANQLFFHYHCQVFDSEDFFLSLAIVGHETNGRAPSPGKATAVLGVKASNVPLGNLSVNYYLSITVKS